MPKGLVGLLIGMVFLAAWGSISAALNSLTSSTVIDLYQSGHADLKHDSHYYRLSKLTTVFWGVFCIAVAMFATRLGSLIEAVNVLGSLFYGTILGLFVVAFYFKKISGTPVFYAAIVSEVIVIAVYLTDTISFLWLNLIGCALVIFYSLVLQSLQNI